MSCKKTQHTKQFKLDAINYRKEHHIIKLMVRPNKELEARIFSYGNQVEVLKPEWLRRQIAEKIENLLKKYSTVQKDCNIE